MIVPAMVGHEPAGRVFAGTPHPKTGLEGLRYVADPRSNFEVAGTGNECWEG